VNIKMIKIEIPTELEIEKIEPLATVICLHQSFQSTWGFRLYL
jgi:hypothetical protein